MKAEIVLIVDESGSMMNLWAETIAGINGFISEQRKVPGEAYVTAAKFDTEFRHLFVRCSLQTAPTVTPDHYAPRGGTALYDAIGKTMNEVGQRIQGQGVDKVIVCIITDGAENSSHKFTFEKVKEMITHAKSNGWEFMFLGADPTANAFALNAGIPQNMIAQVQANATGTAASYGTFNTMTRALRSGAASASLNAQETYTIAEEEEEAKK